MTKTYWKTLEELAKTPEFEKAMGQEFVTLPKEPAGLERREFLKLMGASLVMASAAACSRRPVEKIVPYLNKPEEVTPGIANWYASTCGECPSACGILAKTREGRPIKLEGNPDHPMNKGGLCARGQASILNLYDPDRIRGPIKNKGNHLWDGVTWEMADGEIGTILKNLREKNGTLRLLTGHVSSPSLQKLIREFLSTFSDAQHIVYEPFSLENITKAQQASYGEAVVPRYRFDKAKFILSLGCDFLDTFLSPVEFTKQFSANRKVKNGQMSRFVCFESALTVTGSNADLHIPIRPGDEIKIALGLANALGGPLSYTLEQAAKETGVELQILKNVTKELGEHRGEGLVLGGNNYDLQIAVNFLNSTLGNDGMTIDALHSPSLQMSGSQEAMKTLIDEMKNGKVDALLIWKTNPAFTLPKSLQFEEALKKVSLVVSFADRVDETAMSAQWVLPDHHTLESWGDAEPQRGLFSLAQPAVGALFNTRAVGDTLLRWTMDYGLLTMDMGKGDSPWYNYLKKYWEENIYKKSGILSSFTTFWETSLRNGVFDSRKSTNGHSPRNFNASLLSSLQVRSPWSVVRSPLLCTLPTIPHYDGRSANNSWLLELPDPVSKITWRNTVSLSPSRAKGMKVQEGDVVKIKTKDFSAELPVHVQPGLHPDTAAVALGFGRTAAGRVGNGIGANGFQFGHGFIQEATFEKTGEWIKLACTQGHQYMEGRPIVKEATLEEYRKNPKVGNEESSTKLPSMWSGHKYEGYRWGMAIDLGSCTGCSACMVACQAENNIPVVGEAQVLKGREMHWIRIDRYYSGNEENPEILNQPMLCQQCENAPCETVCPVVATMHNDEGLNVQIYNRCVGTRYCSNNCPYKVRRFNWFEYLWKEVTPLSLVLNPDVTVREKGVMEKCTFCIQRIREGKDKAKDFGGKVEEGEIQTACQQSCPADAIVFGDLNDRESRVAKLAKEERGYKVLSDLNTNPSITYLTKIWNKS